MCIVQTIKLYFDITKKVEYFSRENRNIRRVAVKRRMNLLEKLFSQRFLRQGFKPFRQNKTKLNEQKRATVKEFSMGFKDLSYSSQEKTFNKKMLHLLGICSAENFLKLYVYLWELSTPDSLKMSQPYLTLITNLFIENQIINVNKKLESLTLFGYGELLQIVIFLFAVVQTFSVFSSI